MWDNAQGAYATLKDKDPNLSKDEKMMLWGLASIPNTGNYNWKENQVTKAKQGETK